MGQIDGHGSGKTVDYKRQVGMFDPERVNAHITIAGLGNIGSHTALALARMGIKRFSLFDFDSIEEHNLSSQAYALEEVGQKKVDAIAIAMRRLNPAVEIETHDAPFTGKEMKGTILISAVDSMEARRTIAAGLPDVYVVDGRMGGGQIEVWSQKAAEWPRTLEKDGDTDPCGARFISYTSYIIAGLIANNVKRHLLKQRVTSRILLHTDTLEILRI